MAKFKDIASIWNNIREVDLRPLRDAALAQVRIALIGEMGVGRHTLAAQLRKDPAREGVYSQSPLLIATLDEAPKAAGADLIILMVDATHQDYAREQQLASQWSDSGKKVVVFCNKYDLLQGGQVLGQWVGWAVEKVLYGSVTDAQYLQRELVPAVLELLPEQHLSLGRHFPLFRLPIARQLISETCFSNTAYAVSTGIAEVVPALDLPLNVTDLIVLTKSQAFLAYKLGLLLGFSTRWQDYVGEFGSVIGGGFLWRQLARSLVGLIPVWGIVPKVAVSYAGTFVVGHAILQWYLTGRHLSPKQLHSLYLQAFARGKDAAMRMLQKVPRPRLGKKKQAVLPAGQEAQQLPEGTVEATPQGESAALLKGEPIATVTKPAPKEKRKLFAQRRKKEKPSPAQKICAQCGRPNAEDASFCQFCGIRLTN
ncbi:MAG: hypothetical protein JW726_02895 [Anaerolineales bacterium]|nr:hypothetical protein [Anaerolineales bacterium]